MGITQREDGFWSVDGLPTYEYFDHETAVRVAAELDREGGQSQGGGGIQTIDGFHGPEISFLFDGLDVTAEEQAGFGAAISVSVPAALKAAARSALRSSNLGAGDLTLAVADGSEFTYPADNNPINVDRTLTLSPIGATDKEMLRICQHCVSAEFGKVFTVINGGPGGETLLTIGFATRVMAEFIFEGGNWSLARHSNLAA
jgi:hypothetical protein